MHESFLPLHEAGEGVVVAGEDGGGKFFTAGHDDGAEVDGQILDAGDAVAGEGVGAELVEGGIVRVVGVAELAGVGGEAGVERGGRRQRIRGGGEGGGGAGDDDALSDPAGDEDAEGARGGGQAGGKPQREGDPAGGVQGGGERDEGEAGKCGGAQHRERGERGQGEKRGAGGEQAEGFAEDEGAPGNALGEEEAEAAGLAVFGDETVAEDDDEKR